MTVNAPVTVQGYSGISHPGLQFLWRVRPVGGRRRRKWRGGLHGRHRQQRLVRGQHLHQRPGCDDQFLRLQCGGGGPGPRRNQRRRRRGRSGHGVGGGTDPDERRAVHRRPRPVRWAAAAAPAAPARRMPATAPMRSLSASGGSGGSGGAGGQVTVGSTSAIQTTGDHASGLVAQSIGGGGGIGAASTSGASGGGQVTATLAIGGSGGSGGAGGDVSLTFENVGVGMTLNHERRACLWPCRPVGGRRRRRGWGQQRQHQRLGQRHRYPGNGTDGRPGRRGAAL